MKKMFAMLLALCMMCGAMVAGAEEVAVQEVKVGKATFEIPAALSMTSNGLLLDGVNIAMCEGDQYTIIIETFDWKAMPYDLDNTSEDEHGDNFFMGAYLFFENPELAANMLGLSERLIYKNGMVIIDYATDGATLVTRYEQNNGCAILVMQGNSPLTAAQGYEIGVSVAESFRIDGVSEKDIAADAEADSGDADTEAAQQYVVITNSSANIRSGPDGSAQKIATAVKGDTFPLVGEEGNWYIIDVNGQNGYVTKSLSAIQN